MFYFPHYLKWIGRFGPVPWPAKFPDLTPLAFYLWGHMKSLIYETPVESENKINKYISHSTIPYNPMQQLRRYFGAPICYSKCNSIEKVPAGSAFPKRFMSRLMQLYL